MMDLASVEAALAQLPLYAVFRIRPEELEFTERVRRVCEQECPMYGRTWACPPAVGTVDECRRRCLGYENCLVMATVAEVSDIGNLEEALSTRPGHEAVTDAAAEILRSHGAVPYVLSTQACALCQRCAWLDGEPCRFPGKMHPCVESHGINLIPTLEKEGVEFLLDRQTVIWFSLLFY